MDWGHIFYHWISVVYVPIGSPYSARKCAGSLELSKAIRGSAGRQEMKQLCAVRRQVQIEAVFLQADPVALMRFTAQQVVHLPGVVHQFRRGERHAALAAVRREVHHDEIEIRRSHLPLHGDKILRRGIFRPGRGGVKRFAFSMPNGRLLEHCEQLFVERQRALQLRGTREFLFDDSAHWCWRTLYFESRS